MDVGNKITKRGRNVRSKRSPKRQFMSDVLSVAPEKKSKVNVLKAEHRQFSKSLEEIMNALKGMHKKRS